MTSIINSSFTTTVMNKVFHDKKLNRYFKEIIVWYFDVKEEIIKLAESKWNSIFKIDYKII